jgi:alginate O-acetyltransferase complex protein AlgI
MLFSSTLFLFCFLPLVLSGNFLLPGRWRNAWLLAASLVFYGWGEPFVVTVMLASVAANWAFGLWVARAPTARLPLVATLAFNLGLLVLFKYADWLVGVASRVLLTLGWIRTGLPDLAVLVPADWSLHAMLFTAQGYVRLPIGVSFFTFQAMSYVIDVRRGVVAPQRNVLRLALYKSLFPQLIAGPIVRYRDVAAQIARRTVAADDFAAGVHRFVIGLAKKMLIANTVAVAADAIFAIPGAALTPACAWFGLFCYTVQIYFDFSGYSDMAIGLGRMLGFRFLENFDYPYVARSVTEFWRRWHISLSTWFRDYLYIPLGGNRRGSARTFVNLLVVFALCGLWHGAHFTFLAWGLWHGAFLVLERAGLGTRLERLPPPLRHAYALLAVTLGWVPFRATSLSHAGDYLRALAFAANGDAARWHVDLFANPLVVTALAAAVVGATPVAAAGWVRLAAATRDRVPAVVAMRTAGLLVLALLFVASCVRMAAGTYNPFLYWRF